MKGGGGGGGGGMRSSSSDLGPLCLWPKLNKHNTHILLKFGVSFLLVGLAFRLLLSSSDPITFLPPSFSSSSSSSDAVVAVAVSTNPHPVPPVLESTTASSSFSSYSPPPPLPIIDDHDQDHANATAGGGGGGNTISSNATTPPANGTQATASSPPPPSSNEQVGAAPKCDIFRGDWVPDGLGPVYTNKSCPEIEAHQNCMRNGRPDSGYLHWRWSPQDCELPRFDPRIFLDMMRDKSWAFIGDSISRNHVQSLLCILYQVEEAVEVYHDEAYRSKRWHFATHNFTLSVIWTPFLIEADVFEDSNGVSSSEIQLHLDKLDVLWMEQYKSFDYAVIAGGKWFLKTAIYHENGTVLGCHYCPGRNLTELGFDYAYRKALRLIFNFVTESQHRAMVIFRTITPDHFENGQWFSGGTCNRTVPFKEGEIEMNDVDRIMRNIELEEFDRGRGTGSKNGVVLKLLDTTRLALLRPDGHPGPYRQFQPSAKDKNTPVQNDCLHWCLPGPIDSWNDLMMQMLAAA
ncbi:protein trichome birefringence-like 23 isoform X2 [Punica granatum]|uniref:Protein trichome birefringence-like 23 isoform X2 n=2 Tax=Punica granatum TaxID=22663 RepID=A0A6P8D3H1_PUNGR|nr:protein trichome birefringence-like 23 isoform X2 [Punica granatum]